MVEDILSSILVFCRRFAEANGFDLKVANLDAHTDETQWPEGDFIGPAELQIEFDEKHVSVEGAICLSSRDDTNLFRLQGYTNALAKVLLPNKSIPLLDARSGREYAVLGIMNGTRVMPPMKTRTQPVRPIMFRAGAFWSVTQDHD